MCDVFLFSGGGILNYQVRELFERESGYDPMKFDESYTYFQDLLEYRVNGSSGGEIAGLCDKLESALDRISTEAFAWEDANLLFPCVWGSFEPFVRKAAFILKRDDYVNNQLNGLPDLFRLFEFDGNERKLFHNVHSLRTTNAHHSPFYSMKELYVNLSESLKSYLVFVELLRDHKRRFELPENRKTEIYDFHIIERGLPFFIKSKAPMLKTINAEEALLGDRSYITKTTIIFNSDGDYKSRETEESNHIDGEDSEPFYHSKTMEEFVYQKDSNLVTVKIKTTKQEIDDEPIRQKGEPVGRKAGDLGPNGFSEYYFDDKGRVSSQKVYANKDKSSIIREENIFTYNSDGSMSVKCYRYTDQRRFDCEKKYDNTGRIRKVFFEDGSEGEYLYVNGKLSEIHCPDGDKFRYETRDNGQITHQKVYVKLKELNEESLYEEMSFNNGRITRYKKYLEFQTTINEKKSFAEGKLVGDICVPKEPMLECDIRYTYYN